MALGSLSIHVIPIMVVIYLPLKVLIISWDKPHNASCLSTASSIGSILSILKLSTLHNDQRHTHVHTRWDDAQPAQQTLPHPINQLK